MLLSIGMIVKNEEKRLRSCLQALQPILQELDAELIIVDTGSTDHTIQIAKEYTDKVFFYEWTSDFAAARNVTLDKAIGDWYMFVDADEIAEEIEDLIRFFKLSEYKKYNSATICIRNYSDAGKKIFSDFNVPRLIKRTEKICFIGAIHERFNAYPSPIKTLSATFGHDGYFYATTEERALKCERNRKLLFKEIEEKPNFGLPYLQLMEAYEAEENFEEALHFYSKGMEVAKKENKPNLVLGFYVNGIYCNYHMGKSMETLNLIDEYFKKKGKSNTLDLEIYVWKAMALLSVNDYTNAETAFEKYDELYHEYHSNRILTDEMAYHSLRFISPMEYYEMVLRAAEACRRRADYSAALVWLNKFTKDSPITMHGYLSRLKIEFDVMKYKGNFYRSIELYADVTKETAQWFQYGVFIFARENKSTWQDMLRELTKCDNNDDLFIEYLRVIYDDLLECEGVEKRLQNVVDRILMSEIYQGLIYLMIKYKTPLPKLISMFDAYELKAITKKVKNQWEDLDFWVYEYIQEVEPENAKELLWVGLMIEGVLGLSDSIDTEKKMFLLSAGAQCLYNYLQDYMREDFFNHDGIELLPKDIRFGYYVYSAILSIERGELEKARAYLTEAAVANPEIKDVLAIVQDEMIENEMDSHAHKIKESIEFLVSQGQYESAKRTLESYRELCPNDLDIERLESLWKTV